MSVWGQPIARRVQKEVVDGVAINTYSPRPQTIHGALRDSADAYPNHIALVEEELSLSYQEFYRLVLAFAGQLRLEYGIEQGQRVALFCRNTIAFCVATYAVLQAGGIVVPVSTKLRTQEALTILVSAEPALIITELEFWQQELTGVQPAPLLLVNSRELLQINGEQAFFPDVDEQAVAFLMHTSGTTGNPKGAMLTHFNVIHGAMNYHLCYGVGHDDTTVVSVPIFHGTGLMAQFMTMIYAGGTLILLPKFSAAETLRIFSEKKVTYFIAPPTVYALLLQEPECRSHAYALRVCVVGGAPLPGQLYHDVRAWLPETLFINTYGLTEATSPAMMTPLELVDKYREASIGMASPCMEAKIADPATGKVLPFGEHGELWIKGALVCKGYWKNSQATAAAIHDGWLRTGDIAYMLEDGFVFVCDRIKNMINRGGEKVYSIEVEDVLHKHPAILEAAVIGVPDKIYGEVVEAFAVTKPGYTLTQQQVVEWAQGQLAKYKVPEKVSFLPALPRNASGKVVKQALLALRTADSKRD